MLVFAGILEEEMGQISLERQRSNAGLSLCEATDRPKSLSV